MTNPLDHCHPGMLAGAIGKRNSWLQKASESMATQTSAGRFGGLIATTFDRALVIC